MAACGRSAFGAWTFVSLAATAAIYQLYRPLHDGMGLRTVAGMEFSQILTYAPLRAMNSAQPIRMGWSSVRTP